MNLLKFIFSTSKKLKEEYNAYVCDEQTKTGDYEYIKPEDIPSDSWERREDNGRMVHYLTRYNDGSLHPIDAPPQIGENESPKAVYTALNCPEIEVVFGIPDSLWDKAPYVALYVLIGAFLIFLFLIWSTAL